MATTTNYGWETPDDTDLVKDGAAAIRTLGNSVDTTTKALNPSTTLGDIEYRSSTSNTNARLGIGSAGQVLTVASGVPSWATPTTGDIEGVSAGTGISGGGTSGTVTITNSMATAIDAKGDLIVGTGADAFSRLAVGATNGHILQVDSAEATGMKWAAPASSSGPAFRAFRNTSSQSINYQVYTKVQLNGETFDTGNCFDSTTNYRFTPTTAGYYQLGFTVQLSSATEEILAIIYKNGTASSRGSTGKADTEYSFGLSSGTDLIYFNGSSDYVELYVIALQNAGSPSVYNGTAETFFTGVWIRS